MIHEYTLSYGIETNEKAIMLQNFVCEYNNDYFCIALFKYKSRMNHSIFDADLFQMFTVCLVMRRLLRRKDVTHEFRTPQVLSQLLATYMNAVRRIENQRENSHEFHIGRMILESAKEMTLTLHRKVRFGHITSCHPFSSNKLSFRLEFVGTT